MDDQNEDDKDSAIICTICEKEFLKPYYLYKHYRRVHKTEPDVKKTIVCPVVDCEIKNRNYEELRDHIKINHGISVESETLFFPSMSEFETWKEEMENNCKSSYVIKKTTRLANDSLKQYFWCNRSGVSDSKWNEVAAKRAPRAKGSRKINSHCPSTLEVVQRNNDVQVIFHKTHLGHDLEFKHLPINKLDKESFAVKIADGIPLDRCLDDIKKSLTGSFKKIHSVTKKDLRNIGNSYQLFNEERLHSEDGVSLDLWVQDMNELGEHSPVLLYKPHGEHFENLQDEDFCLILMTVAQKEMLKKFGKDKICVDSTHETTIYHYVLTTVLVIDEFNGGFPVAFCLKHIDNIIKLANNEKIMDINKVSEPTNKKIEVQRRLYSTKKKCVKPNSIKKPTASMKVAIKDAVKTEDDVLFIHDAFDHVY